MSDETPRVVQHADDAHEAIRAINHETIYGEAMPAPLVYAMLGSLKGLGPGLSQTLGQIARGLVASLDVYDVYDRSGREPAASVEAAQLALHNAAEAAAELGRCLERAQQAISLQGYHPAADTNGR